MLSNKRSLREIKEEAEAKQREKEIEENNELIKLLKESSERFYSKECVDDTKFCSHTHIIKDAGRSICRECGQEIYLDYSDNDSKSYNSNRERVSYRKFDEKGIVKDLEMLGYCEDIVLDANKLFLDVIKDDITRKYCRKGIIFACICNTFKRKGMLFSPDEVMAKLQITHKIATRGMRLYALACNKEDNILYIDPTFHLIKIMKEVECSEEDQKKIINLYNRIKSQYPSIKNLTYSTLAVTIISFYYKNGEMPEKLLKNYPKTKITKKIDSILVN